MGSVMDEGEGSAGSGGVSGSTDVWVWALEDGVWGSLDDDEGFALDEGVWCQGDEDWEWMEGEDGGAVACKWAK